MFVCGSRAQIEAAYAGIMAKSVAAILSAVFSVAAAGNFNIDDLQLQGFDQMDYDETANWESGDWGPVKKSLGARREKDWKTFKSLMGEWKKARKGAKDDYVHKDSPMESLAVALATAWWKALGSTTLYASILIEMDEKGMASKAIKLLKEVRGSNQRKDIGQHVFVRFSFVFLVFCV